MTFSAIGVEPAELRSSPAAPITMCGTSGIGTDAVTSSRRGSTTRITGSVAAASTRSPGLWKRFATTPSNRARTVERAADASEASCLCW